MSLKHSCDALVLGIKLPQKHAKANSSKVIKGCFIGEEKMGAQETILILAMTEEKVSRNQRVRNVFIKAFELSEDKLDLYK